MQDVFCTPRMLKKITNFAMHTYLINPLVCLFQVAHKLWKLDIRGHFVDV